MSSSTFQALSQLASEAKVKKVFLGGSQADKDEKLQRFSIAKKELGDVYSKLGSLNRNVLDIYDGTDEADRENFLSSEIVQQMRGYLGSIKSIKLILLRDKMKVVFFGGTSNGKSMVANAMIGKQLLPSGIGTTTCCFLQVDGGDVEEACFTAEGCDMEMPISKLKEAGDALSKENKDLSTKGKDKLFKIVYPRSESKLLQNDVLMMDSPGIGVDDVSDGWIQKHCIDADLFVLVNDANRMLSNVEKEFIIVAKETIVSPNVFVLCNKWDITDEEDDDRMHNLRRKHERDMLEFFAKLDLAIPCGAENMPFFVSGKEMLNVRCNGFKIESDRSKLRQKEFLRFEKSFTQCISASAIHTKLNSHVKRAVEMNGEIFLNINRLHAEKLDDQDRKLAEIERMDMLRDDRRNNFDSLKEFYELKLAAIRSMVRKEVTEGFEPIFTELDSGSFFKAFKWDIRDGEQGIEFCKQELISYIEAKCRPYLESRYSVELLVNVENVASSFYDKAKLIFDGQYDAMFDKCCVDNKFSWAAASNTCNISERMELRKPFNSKKFREALNCWDVFFRTYGTRLEKYLRDEYIPHLKSKLEPIRDDQAGMCEEQIIGELIRVFNAVKTVYHSIQRVNGLSCFAKLDGQSKITRDVEKIWAAKSLSVEIGQDLNSFRMKHLQT